MRIARWPVLFPLLACAVASTSLGQTPSTAPTPSLGELEITDKTRIALEKLPYYGPFDLIAFQVKGTVVTLFGWVYQGTNKEDAVDSVKKVPGVTRVADEIQLLPASIEDDRIRRTVFRAIYSDDFLQKYGTPVLGLTTGRWGRR